MAYLSGFYLLFWLSEMAIISKVHKPYNLESHKSLKLSFTNIQGNCPKFVDWELLLEANSPDIFALCETNMEDWLILAILWEVIFL